MQNVPFYASENLVVRDCAFDGPADGESAFKECTDVQAEHCFFNLRYPFWHNHGLKIIASEMTALCRAVLWYSDHIEIANTKLHGIKALRECSQVTMHGCSIISPEFGWSVHEIEMADCDAEGEYFMMRSSDLHFSNVRMKGKYSFQYIENSIFQNCVFDTKDAFWHARNVVVRDSVIKGEYLAWYCENVTLENCRIIGTQPLCYCKGLKLINCEMVDCDLTLSVLRYRQPLLRRYAASRTLCPAASLFRLWARSFGIFPRRKGNCDKGRSENRFLPVHRGHLFSEEEIAGQTFRKRIAVCLNEAA